MHRGGNMSRGFGPRNGTPRPNFRGRGGMGGGQMRNGRGNGGPHRGGGSNRGGRFGGKSSNGAGLKSRQWDISTLQPFKKNFYIPNNCVDMRTPEDIKQYRDTQEITLKVCQQIFNLLCKCLCELLFCYTC